MQNVLLFCCPGTLVDQNWIMELDLAISPCPNDTYIFHHLIQNGSYELQFGAVLEDVQELNRRAIEEKKHSITKLSYFAASVLTQDYRLIGPGGAMGHGCGPLLITNSPESSGLGDEQISRILSPSSKGPLKILVPGVWTTANLLVHLFLDELHINPQSVQFIPERYDRILAKLQSGEEQYGVIIHEERFTYRKAGLFPVRDLGEWWEQVTALPIPLGAIMVRNDLDHRMVSKIEEGIVHSIEQARKDIQPAWPFIKENARALEDEVIQAHIDLYVNEYSIDPGERGRRAIAELFRRSARAGITGSH